MRLYLNKKIIFFILAAILLITLLNFYQSPARNFFYLISQPLQKPLWSLGQKTAGFFQTILRYQKIQKVNKELHLLTQELLSKVTKLSETEKENQTLREALHIGLSEEFKLILAQVTAKEIAQDTLIINRGLKHGVKNNEPVVNQQKILLGKITRVHDDFSEVQLISNKKSSFEGKTSASSVRGLVKGAGNFKATFDLVPQYEEIKEGELLTTTALGGIFPSGLLVGQVKTVKKSDLDPFQQIEIQPLFDLKHLDRVFIVAEF